MAPPTCAPPPPLATGDDDTTPTGDELERNIPVDAEDCDRKMPLSVANLMARTSAKKQQHLKTAGHDYENCRGASGCRGGGRTGGTGGGGDVGRGGGGAGGAGAKNNNKHIVDPSRRLLRDRNCMGGSVKNVVVKRDSVSEDGNIGY